MIIIVSGEEAEKMSWEKREDLSFIKKLSGSFIAN